MRVLVKCPWAVLVKAMFFGLGAAAMVALPTACIVPSVDFILRASPRAKALVGRPRVDVIFVVDASTDMQPEWAGLARGLSAFVAEAVRCNVDLRLGLTSFGGRDSSGRPTHATFGESPLTADPSQLMAKLKEFAPGEHDSRGSPHPVEALAAAAEQSFPGWADRCLVLVTSAAADDSETERMNAAQYARRLRVAGIGQIHVLAPKSRLDVYVSMMKGVRCETYEMATTTSGRQELALLLPTLAYRIGYLARGGPPGRSEAGWLPHRVVAYTLLFLWLFLGPALLAIHRFYARSHVLGIRQYALATMPGIGAGAVGLTVDVLMASVGAVCGIVLSLLIAGVAGCLAMLIFARAVPGMNRFVAVASALAGALLLTVALRLAPPIQSPVACGVLVASLGAGCWGLALPVLEAARATRWIEVRSAPLRPKLFSLDARPLIVGSDRRQCHVVIDGGPATAARFWVDKGHVKHYAFATGTLSTLADAACVKLGAVNILVGSSQLPTWRRRQSQAPKHEFQLRLGSGHSVPLVDGMVLTALHLPGVKSGSTAGTVAQVVRNPHDPTVLGLKNLSASFWRATPQGGPQKPVNTNQSVRLAVGTEIDFGSVSGQIVEA